MSEVLSRGRPPIVRPRDAYEMRLQREAGIPIRDVAKFHNVSRTTVLRVLADLRKKLGPEKLPNERRARSYLGRLQQPTP